MRTFVAYADGHPLTSTALDGGASLATTAGTDARTWREVNVAGSFIRTKVLDEIATSNCLVADVSYLNFNVAYEIGYAIGRGLPVVLVKHAGVDAAASQIRALGIYDTIGYVAYENQEDVAAILKGALPAPLWSAVELNGKAPVYLLESRFKTDAQTRILSRVKKARLFFRSFDPTENPRLAASDAIRHVAQSYGVLLHLLPSDESYRETRRPNSLHQATAAC